MQETPTVNDLVGIGREQQVNKDKNPVLFEQIFLAYARDISSHHDHASKKSTGYAILNHITQQPAPGREKSFKPTLENRSCSHHTSGPQISNRS